MCKLDWMPRHLSETSVDFKIDETSVVDCPSWQRQLRIVNKLFNRVFALSIYYSLFLIEMRFVVWRRRLLNILLHLLIHSVVSGIIRTYVIDFIGGGVAFACTRRFNTYAVSKIERIICRPLNRINLLCQT